jgi:Protein of unknown function (DUF3005)
MNDSSQKPTQSQQSAINNQSPSKEPAHETGRADAGHMERDFERNPNAENPPDAKIARDPDPLPDVNPSLETKHHPDPLVTARSRIISVDTQGTEASDSTVDTDGKSRQARRHHGLRRDHQVHSNAVLDDHVVTPTRGLGGIDSRAEGNLVRLALRPGWHVVDMGSTSYVGFNGARGARHFRLEQHGSDATGQGNPPATDVRSPHDRIDSEAAGGVSVLNGRTVGDRAADAPAPEDQASNPSTEATSETPVNTPLTAPLARDAEAGTQREPLPEESIASGRKH